MLGTGQVRDLFLNGLFLMALVMGGLARWHAGLGSTRFPHWPLAPGTPDLVPDLVPKYVVTVGTRWYLLGLAAAPLYQRVPTSPNSHKHNQDSNSLGGTIKPQVTGLSSPISSANSGYKCLWAEGGCEVKAQLRGGVDARAWLRSTPCCPQSSWARLVARSNPVSPIAFQPEVAEYSQSQGQEWSPGEVINYLVQDWVL